MWAAPHDHEYRTIPRLQTYHLRAIILFPLENFWGTVSGNAPESVQLLHSHELAQVEMHASADMPSSSQSRSTQHTWFG